MYNRPMDLGLNHYIFCQLEWSMFGAAKDFCCDNVGRGCHRSCEQNIHGSCIFVLLELAMGKFEDDMTMQAELPSLVAFDFGKHLIFFLEEDSKCLAPK